MRKRTLLLAASLTTGLLTALPTTVASAAPAKYADDFNGDGYRDVAVAAPFAQVGSVSGAGAVVVLYGSASGVSAAKRTVITQNSPGVPDTAEGDDRFGISLASGDLDRDGYADLVVGAQYESIGSRDGVGRATVLWGGKRGLSGGTVLPQPSTLSEWGGFSSGVSVADFDGDGKPDVTVTGQASTRLYKGPFTRTRPASHTTVSELGSTYEVAAGDLNRDGAAERIYPFAVDGDAGGDISYFTWTGTKYVRQLLPKADGLTASVADVNGDRYGDLVLGDYADPYSGKPAGHKGGQIYVWYGGPTGPDPAQKPTVINQDTAGVPDTGEADDRFGAALSTGDVNGDGYADVAVGAPGEAVGSKKYAGAVTILYGSAKGLTGKGSKTFTQNTAGIPGTVENWDGFGQSVRLVDLNRNGRADLVVGSGDEDDQRGAVTVIKGATSGLNATGAKLITAANLALKGSGGLGWTIGQ
ncbi:MULTISPECIES: FG-GAP-like repeat-containing protein [Streptomyces]|uniref:FG-GAP-like repeat-containing protein n=2 Tax=Streptomyces TaxID=1883 RepID=A0ABV9J876_9ACTN